MPTYRLAIAILILVACKAHEATDAPSLFTAQRATSIEVGDFAIKIPPDMRDAAEIIDAANRKTIIDKAMSGKALVLAAKISDLLIAIVPMSTSLDATNEHCATVGSSVGESSHMKLDSVRVVKMPVGPACMLNLSSTAERLTEYFVPHGAKTLLILCVVDAANQVLLDVDCDTAARGVTAK